MKKAGLRRTGRFIIENLGGSDVYRERGEGRGREGGFEGEGGSGGRAVSVLHGKQDEEGWFEEDGDVHHRELKVECCA